MYNSIYPININYRKNPYQTSASNSNAKGNSEYSQNTSEKNNYIPASNRINISQILMDFKNTILAINAPKDVQDEVGAYLNLVDKESKKETPSKDIIFSNLKNASIISDEFITSALGKKSNVVEGWISTFFRQDINLKANPNEINPDFLLKFPQKTEVQTQAVEQKETSPEKESTIQQKTEVIEPQIVDESSTVEPVIIKDSEEIENNSEIDNEIKIADTEVDNTKEIIDVENSLDTISDSENIFINTEKPQQSSPFTPLNQSDEKAKILYMQAKRIVKSDDDYTGALNMLNDALGYLSDTSNSNIKAAIHFERGKIFDKYDYVDYALRDYYEATKADDLNLKANAYYKTGSIYDEFKEFDPALDNYLSSVAYSGEAENLSAQSKVLSKISNMYTRVYDAQNAQNYADLAIDSAVDSKNNTAIASVYSSIADNYSYLGENEKALNNYKKAVFNFSNSNDSFEQMGYNYSQAAKVMYELGNKAKAAKLQAKADLYYQKAQLAPNQQAKAS